MKLRNTSSTYGAVAIVFHWIVAIVVIGLFASGLWMVDLAYYDVWYHRAPALHKAVGILLVLTMVLRLILRWSDRVPQTEPGVRPWEARSAAVVHTILYVAVFAAAISGYLMSTAKGDPVDVFNLFAVPATVYGLPRQEDVAGDFHYWIAVVLIALASLHVLAALKHHFVDRDATLLRMLGLKRP